MTIPGESKASDLLSMTFKSAQRLLSPPIPEADGLITGTRGQHSSIRRPCHALDSVRVAFKSFQSLSCLPIPEADSLIYRTRSQHSSIRRSGNAVDYI